MLGGKHVAWVLLERESKTFRTDCQVALASHPIRDARDNQGCSQNADHGDLRWVIPDSSFLQPRYSSMPHIEDLFAGTNKFNGRAADIP